MANNHDGTHARETACVGAMAGASAVAAEFGGIASHRPVSRELAAAVHSIASLSHEDREEMWSVYARFYEGTSRERFARDLARKDSVLVLRDALGDLQGFSSIALWTKQFEGRTVRVLFSGDTIVERAHWGTQALAFNWLRFAGAVKAQQPDLPLYWFLIVKGQRTYRYLPTFAREFTPDWRGSRPHLERLARELAREYFGPAYDPATGVVHFTESHGHLAPQWAEFGEREAARADVRYFLLRNPGYVYGDELVCLCELTAENLRPLARRLFLDGAAQ